MFTRRHCLVQGLALAAPSLTHALPARTLRFPRDHGSHPDLRTEWWYITGHAQAAGRLWGFQVTFFRSRVDAAQGLQSAFAAKQLLFAHAAVTDVQGQRLRHGQRIARAGFGVAQASEDDTRVRLQDWTLERAQSATGSRYTAQVEGDDFSLGLRFDSTQPLLLQGQQGLSRKGPLEQQASYYYSQPQLAVEARWQPEGAAAAARTLAGRGWLDHEWSETLLHPQAVGWDWIGMNLDDGAALTAFHLRRADGSTLWAGGSLRTAAGVLRVFQANEVRFEAQSHWLSPHTQARYPTRWRVHTPAGSFTVQALLDDQELDSRSSTGAVYWEGLSDLLGAQGQRVGRGYLEMTGYAAPLKL